MIPYLDEIEFLAIVGILIVEIIDVWIGTRKK